MGENRLEALNVLSEPVNLWSAVDMTRRLRMRSFQQLCLPPLFQRLEVEYQLSRMRQRGVVQVMYYLDLEQQDVALEVTKPLRIDHELRMYRSVADPEGWPAETGTERILWHSVSRIDGHRHSSEPAGGGTGNHSTELVRGGGIGRAIHILTKPAAPRGERAVRELPNELESFQLHPWTQRLPSLSSLREVPSGYTPSPFAFEQHYNDIWGNPNTDANQHVNVLEYVMGFENQTSRHLAAAGFDLTKHRICRLRALFRRPCFAGERYLLVTQLYLNCGYTYFLGQCFPLDAAGTPATQPAVAAVIEGTVMQ